ncbi:hypothetical protein [Asticcacaulis machinosus]|uniref:Uncharacterized protein n=1 Tax=Asticcacaulis machinosus TaxID=2984211 RepID=A0ABT5HMS6_9CAUL|nr:hypothetical protein [Asticcacaulis machinosus]MDC7677549.1 hypothetical protein [Asticcacaulis machinosus]
MPVTVDQFLNAALDRDIDASRATGDCQTYFDLLRDLDFFQRTLAQRARACRGQTDDDLSYQKTAAALAQVKSRLQDIEQVYGLVSH